MGSIYEKMVIRKWDHTDMISTTKRKRSCVNGPLYWTRESCVVQFPSVKWTFVHTTVLINDNFYTIGDTLVVDEQHFYSVVRTLQLQHESQHYDCALRSAIENRFWSLFGAFAAVTIIFTHSFDVFSQNYGFFSSAFMKQQSKQNKPKTKATTNVEHKF